MRHWMIGALALGLLGCTETAEVVEVTPPPSPAELTPEQLAGPKANRLFASKPLPTIGEPAPVGGYARGCAFGLRALPESGPTWQAMRLSRNRYWGHPETIDFLQTLSAFAATQPGWEGLYIGDLSQPRGGPMLTGHQSHQIGLDADIWMLPPQSLTLSEATRESLSSISIAPSFRVVNENWSDSHAAILEAAARDERVDRIFVTAPAKIEMCKTATAADKDWLQKIRPFWGHHYHFHVRLKCPEGSTACVTQTPSVDELSKGGDGCDETLQWWVTAALDPPDPNAPAPPPRRNVRDFVMEELPAQCQTVLNVPG